LHRNWPTGIYTVLPHHHVREMSTTLQANDLLLTAAQQKIQRAASICSRCSMTMVIGARSSPPNHARIRLHPAAALDVCASGRYLESTEPQPDPACCRAHPLAATARWRLQHLRQRPSEISASVKAYFALKVAGILVDDARMVRLRECILALGGSRRLTATQGQPQPLRSLSARRHAEHSAEIMLLPGKLLYQMSS